MRQLRVRLRSLIVLFLTIFSFLFFITLNTFIRSTENFESSVENDQTSNHAVIQPNSNPSRIDKFYRQVLQSHNLFIKSKLTVAGNENSSRRRSYAKRDDPSNSGFRLQEQTTIVSAKLNQNQVRSIVYERLSRWKEKYQNETTVTLAEIMHESLMQDYPKRLNTSWFAYLKSVTNHRVYHDVESSELKLLFQYLQYGEVLRASEIPQGTQIKLVLDLDGGFQGLLKPHRVPRNYQTEPDHFYFNDIERHHAEIGAFHVDKVLGFNRVPPVIGRVFNITNDLRLKATEELARTFFSSPADNICFRGHCTYYCDTAHAVCGKPGDHLEGSLQVFLPRSPEINWQKLTHPYRRSYNAVKTAAWQNNENYCYDYVLADEDYHTRLILDMMDLSAFDFFIGNLDRHHMMRISAFGENTALVHLDNGRAFGRHDYDDLSILAPIRQCCFFRFSTFQRLHQVYRQGFSRLVRRSLEENEQLKMILIDEHLHALDRRLRMLFAQLEVCVAKHSINTVFIDDGIK